MDIGENFGKDIKALFGKAKYKNIHHVKRGFATNKIVQHDTILFIGLNPSYRKNDQDFKESFWDPGQSCTDRYFKPFVKISQYCDNTPWSHLDLLPIRETNQKEFEKLEKHHLNFIWENLMISKEILEAHKPRVIVVTNTLARKYLGKDRWIDKKGKERDIWLGYQFGKMEEDGTFRILNEDSNLKNVPVFFSSMLSGQRALDKGSFERLKWHIDKVLKEQA